MFLPAGCQPQSTPRDPCQHFCSREPIQGHQDTPRAQSQHAILLQQVCMMSDEHQASCSSMTRGLCNCTLYCRMMLQQHPSGHLADSKCCIYLCSALNITQLIDMWEKPPTECSTTDVHIACMCQYHQHTMDAVLTQTHGYLTPAAALDQFASQTLSVWFSLQRANVCMPYEAGAPSHVFVCAGT